MFAGSDQWWWRNGGGTEAWPAAFVAKRMVLLGMMKRPAVLLRQSLRRRCSVPTRHVEEDGRGGFPGATSTFNVTVDCAGGS